MAKKSGGAAAPVDPKAFMSAFASCNDACAQMDFSDQGWKPPVGEYTVQLIDIQTGSKVKDGVENFWAKPIFEVIPPNEFEGRTFSEFIYIQPGVKELTPGLRTLLYLATCLAGREIRRADEAYQILCDSKGEFLEIEVFQSKGKGKNAHRVFTNVRFLNRLESTDADDEGTDEQS